MIQLFQQIQTKDTVSDAEQVSNLSKKINGQNLSGSDEKMADSSFARQLYGVLRQMIGFEQSASSGKAGDSQTDQPLSQGMEVIQALSEGVGSNLQVRFTTGDLLLNSKELNSVKGLMAEQFQSQLNLTESQAAKLMHHFEEHNLDFNDMPSVQKILGEYLSDEQIENLGKLIEKPGMGQGESNNSELLPEDVQENQGAMIEKTRSDSFVQAESGQLKGSNHTGAPETIEEGVKKTKVGHSEADLKSPEQIGKQELPGNKNRAGVNPELNTNTREIENSSKVQNPSTLEGKKELSGDGNRMQRNVTDNKVVGKRIPLDESVTLTDEQGGTDEINSQKLTSGARPVSESGLSLDKEVMMKAESEENSAARQSELKKTRSTGHQVKEVAVGQSKMMENHGLSFGRLVQQEDNESNLSQKKVKIPVQNEAIRTNAMSSEATSESSLETGRQPSDHARIQLNREMGSTHPLQQNKGVFMTEASIDKLANELKSLVDGQNSDFQDIQFLKEADQPAQKIQQSIPVHSAEKNNFASKLAQVVRQEVQSQQSTMKGWKSHQFVFEDGSRVRLAVRQMEGSLQLQLGSMNSELNRLIQTHANEIRQHLQEQMKLNVELHFQSDDSTGQELPGQNPEGAGSMHNRLMDSQVNHGNSIDQPDGRTRLFGFNRNEWTA